MKFSSDTIFPHNISTVNQCFPLLVKLRISILDKKISSIKGNSSVNSCTTKFFAVDILEFYVKAAVKP